jgi:integrase
MPRTFGYYVNIPQGQIKAEPGSDDAKKNELIDFLKKEELIKQYAAKDGAVQAHDTPETFEEMFKIDLPNGIFKADTQDQHDALMNNLHAMKDAGILQSLAQKVIKPAQVLATAASQTIVHVVGATQQTVSMQDVLGRDRDLEKMEEVKNLYHRGLPLTLSQAGEAYIKYSFDAKPVNNITAKNYRSRMNKIIEVCGDRYLHELEDDDVVEIELMLLETPAAKLSKSSTAKNGLNVAAKQDSLKRRTVSERLRHLKAVYKKMKIKRRYSGENPLEHWEALVSSRERKKDGQKSIRSVERVEVIFNGEYYSQFRQKAPNMYLLLMTAIVTGMRASSIARLKEEDLMLSVGGTPMIDVTRDKTVAGVRQVPLPRPLFDALKMYLRENKNMGFRADTADNYSSAISKANRRFKKIFGGETAEQLNAHDMRRSFNEYLKKRGVQLDVRSAVMGHSQREVNVVSYSNGISVDESSDVISTIQEDLLTLMKFQWP